MIGKLKGFIDSYGVDNILLDVNGVCYNINICIRNLEYLSNTKDIVSLLIHSVTKEDGTILYGFLSIEDKLWFCELIKLNGISGRIAMSIIGNLTPQTLASAILLGDESQFYSITGIGKKLASRIVNEMKDAEKKVNQILSLSGATFSYSDSGVNSQQTSLQPVAEAIMALQAMGFNGTSFNKMLTNLYKEDETLTVEELIKKALQVTN